LKPEQISSMIALGEADAQSHVVSKGDVNDTIHYFDLKSKLDDKVKGVTFDQFR